MSAAVGQAIPHESGELHVSGRATYTDDITELTGTLHAAFGLSACAHGRITQMDLSAVTAAPGVVAVLTASDIPGRNDCGPILRDDPILADGLVQFHGQPVFVVLAEGHEAARRAARLAKIEYETLPAFITTAEAIAAQSWVLPPVDMQRGDAQAALQNTPHRLRGSAQLGGQEHFYLEGQVAYALPREQDSMHVHSSTQHPTEMQHIVAHMLGWHSHQVSVECRRMGGGFGGKESQSAQIVAAVALGAWKTGRPVKMRLDRDDDMIITGKRHDFDSEWEVGFDDDGRILGLRLQLASRCGFSADLSGPVNDRALCHVDNCYYLDAVAIRSLRCKTHTVSNTAFRGFGGPQGMFAIEYIIDDIARHLGKDPLDVRRVNLYDTTPPLSPAGRGVGGEGVAPSQAASLSTDPLPQPLSRTRERGASSDSVALETGGEHSVAAPFTRSRTTTPYGMEVEDNVAPAMIEELAASCDYAARRAAIADFNATSPIIKRGIALTPLKFGISFNATLYNQAGALVHVYADGTVLVTQGGTEMGQGLYTKIRQVVAHELGLPVETVRMASTDTSRVPNTSATAASSGADLNGKAAQDAAIKIKQRLARFFAQEHGVPEASVQFGNGLVCAGEASQPFADVVIAAYRARVQLWDSGFYTTPKIHWNRDTMQGRPFFYFAYGVACAEVALDTLSGESRVLRVDILHDVGKSLNPAIDIGQIEGGFIQGMGWLTTEELYFRPDGAQRGRFMTHAPSTYKIPAASDCPPVMNVRLFDNANAEDSIHRSKAVGEPPLMLAFSVFFALRDAACAAAGKAVPLQAPATAESLLRAIGGMDA